MSLVRLHLDHILSLALSIILPRTMAINIAADRDTEKVSEPASSPVAPPPDEYATEEAGDVTEKQIVYLTGFRLKLIAAAYV